MTSPLPERESALTQLNNLRTELSAAVIGQSALIDESLAAMMGGGHVLITGAPGLAKTTLVRVLGQLSGLVFGRVQFTPDLMPSDITGMDVLNIDTDSGKRYFEFMKGPIFTNLLLADEINRASPRTQSALLEAMQERVVTVGGKRYNLPAPFMVFATQNPYESEGTFPLPDAQLDRFLIHCIIEYPAPDAEKSVYAAHAENRLAGESDSNFSLSTQVLGQANIQNIMRFVKAIRVPDELLDVVRDLVRSTRAHDELCPEPFKRAIWYGAGTRAGLALISVARAWAFMQGSESVRWEHIKRMAKPVLRHRIKLTAQAMRDQQTPDRVIDALIERIELSFTSKLNG